MKNLLRFLIPLLIIAFKINPLLAQWIQTNGPYGGFIKSVTVSGSNIFAGTNGAGVFVSTDNGTSWSEANNGLTNTAVYSIISSGTNIFAGTYGGGVFLSTNNGSSWTAVNNGLTTLQVNALAANSQYLFAATSGTVFRSSNNGASWAVTSLSANGVYSVIARDSIVLAGTSYGGTYRSTDNGTTWAQVNTAAFVNAFTITPNGTGGSYIFAGNSGSGVWRSSDYGATWTQVNNGLTYLIVYALAANDSFIFAGTANTTSTIGKGIFRSTDYGNSWTQVNNGLTNLSVWSLCNADNNIFAGTSGGGVYKSDNLGLNWTESSNGIINTTVTSFTANNNEKLFAGTSFNKAFVSTDNGYNWTKTSSLLADTIYTFTASGNYVFAGSYKRGVFRSTDNGESWVQINNGITNMNIQCFAVIINGADTNIIAGTGNGIFRSTNNGDNWTAINSGITNTNILSLTVDGTDVYAGATAGKVFRTTNFGNDWSTISVPNGSASTFALAVQDTNLFAGGTAGIYLSTNKGSSWTLLNNYNVRAFAVVGSNVFTGTATNGIYLTSDNGITWNQINTGLTNTSIPLYSALYIYGSDIFTGTSGAGAWKRSLAELISPTVPINLSASADTFSVSLSWQDSDFENGFKIERKDGDSTSANPFVLIDSVSANITDYLDDGLIANSTYTYRIFAYNNVGNSQYSNLAQATTFDVIPLAPDSLVAVADSFSVALNWTDNSSNELGFKIERKDGDSTSANPFILIDSVTANVDYYINTGLSQNSTYTYRIYAYNLIGNSAYSNLAQATTLYLLPLEPTNLSADVDTFVVTLYWDDNSSNEDGFVVERKDGDSTSINPFVPIDTLGTDVNTYQDTTVNPNTAYQYRIYAFNICGNSGFSNVVEVTTPIPVELTSFTAWQSDNEILINWSTATETNNQGFQIQKLQDFPSGGKKLKEWKTIGYVSGSGTTTEPKNYSFTDKFDYKSYKGTITYRLKQIDFDGSYEYSPEIIVEVDFTPKEYTLYQNYPNPFNPTTTIKYALPFDSHVRISVYNVLGELLGVLVDEVKEVGYYDYSWNASNYASGIYIYTIEAKAVDGKNNFISVKKMLLMK